MMCLFFDGGLHVSISCCRTWDVENGLELDIALGLEVRVRLRLVLRVLRRR